MPTWKASQEALSGVTQLSTDLPKPPTDYRAVLGDAERSPPLITTTQCASCAQKLDPNTRRAVQGALREGGPGHCTRGAKGPGQTGLGPGPSGPPGHPLTLGASLTRYVQPPVISFETIFEQSTPNSPVVFILSPGSDPASDLMKLAERAGFGGNRLKFLAMGQGQEKVACRWRCEGPASVRRELPRAVKLLALPHTRAPRFPGLRGTGGHGDGTDASVVLPPRLPDGPAFEAVALCCSLSPLTPCLLLSLPHAHGGSGLSLPRWHSQGHRQGPGAAVSEKVERLGLRTATVLCHLPGWGQPSGHGNPEGILKDRFFQGTRCGSCITG